jgi:hypothetical protein
MPSGSRPVSGKGATLVLPLSLKPRANHRRTPDPNCPAHLDERAHAEAEKNGETNLDSHDADDLRLSGDVDAATRVGAGGVR